MNRAILRFYFTISIVMLVLLGFAFPFIEPGTGSMVVAQLTLVMLVGAVLATGALIYRERKRGPDLPLEVEDP